MSDSGFLSSARCDSSSWISSRRKAMSSCQRLVGATDDPTLLFTNAGMNQFKDIFLGLRPPSRPCGGFQKVMRSAENTMIWICRAFALSSNFLRNARQLSFADYYKREAIRWAWELLTEVWKLPKERLWATAFEDDKGDLGRDEEAVGFWLSRQTSTEQVLFFGRKDNFWEMAIPGHADRTANQHGHGARCLRSPGRPGHVCHVNGDCDASWNSGIWCSSSTIGLPTAIGAFAGKARGHRMGFERIVSILQHAKTNYETDLFTPIIGGRRRCWRPATPNGTRTSCPTG